MRDGGEEGVRARGCSVSDVPGNARGGFGIYFAAGESLAGAKRAALISFSSLPSRSRTFSLALARAEPRANYYRCGVVRRETLINAKRMAADLASRVDLLSRSGSGTRSDDLHVEVGGDSDAAN